jgi:hypothetical protein
VLGNGTQIPSVTRLELKTDLPPLIDTEHAI